MLVEWLCARNGLVHTSLALAEDDGGAGRGLVAVVQVCAAQCSHALFYASRGLGRRIHGSVEDTKLSTNKQHSLSLTALRVRGRCVCGG